VLAAEAALARGRWDDTANTAATILASPAEGAGYARVSALVALARVRMRRGEPGYRTLLETESAGEPGLSDVRWFAGELDVWRHRAGLDCGDPAELPEPYRLEITGDAGGVARWVAGTGSF
jgi:hypothetical protein